MALRAVIYPVNYSPDMQVNFDKVEVQFVHPKDSHLCITALSRKTDSMETVTFFASVFDPQIGWFMNPQQLGSLMFPDEKTKQKFLRRFPRISALDFMLLTHKPNTQPNSHTKQNL